MMKQNLKGMILGILNNTNKPISETLIKQECESRADKADTPPPAAAAAENKPEKVVEQIKRSAKKKGKKEKRSSTGKKTDGQSSSAAELPDIGKLKNKARPIDKW